jgi:galactokinase
VLPFACDLEVRITASYGGDDVRLWSPDADLARYLAGVLEALRENGYETHALRGEVRSTVPIGAGLSSSAALAAAIALAVTEGAEITPDVLVRAERLASGVPGGVMDQTAVLKARAGHAMLIDCATGAVDHLPIPESVGFVVIDTGTRRQLADGRYAQRRAEVEAGDARRVRHAESEQRRVYEAAGALRAADATSLGALLNESHASLRDDFEVSAPELDLAVEVSNEHPSCFGARLVGAGFAGCALAVVEGDPAAPAEWIERRLGERLPEARSRAVMAMDGAGEVVDE